MKINFTGWKRKKNAISLSALCLSSMNYIFYGYSHYNKWYFDGKKKSFRVAELPPVNASFIELPVVVYYPWIMGHDGQSVNSQYAWTSNAYGLW